MFFQLIAIVGPNCSGRDTTVACWNGRRLSPHLAGNFVWL